MQRSRLVGFVVFVAMVVAAALAATTNASAGTSPTGSAATSVTGSTAAIAAGQAGTVQTSFLVKQFVSRKGRLFARGEVVATVRTADGTRTARKAFEVRVKNAKAARAFKSSRGMNSAQQLQQQQICTVLVLVLGPLHLELLGLIVDLNQVVLVVSADPNGGILGQLLCGLAGGGQQGVAASPTAARQLTKAAKKSGLASGAAATPQQAVVQPQLPPVPEGHCTVLDLQIAPIFLNLLGLIVQTSEIHLRITADPEGGILGQLFCGLAGGPAPPPAPAPVPAPV